MNCLKHPAAVAVGTCAGCAEGFCNLCLVNVRGQRYCGDCKNMAGSGGPGVGPASAGPIGECQEANDALKYSIIGLFCLGIILGPIAISKGVKAKQLISENPRLMGGGKATAGIVIGIIATILHGLGILYRFVLMNN